MGDAAEMPSCLLPVSLPQNLEAKTRAAEGAARLGGGLRKQRALGRLRHLGVRISLLMNAASDSSCFNLGLTLPLVGNEVGGVDVMQLVSYMVGI